MAKTIKETRVGILDKVKQASTDLAQQANDKVQNSIESKKIQHENKQLARQENKERKHVFIATKEMEDISIDSNNELFKVKHASANIKKKTGFMGKAGKATAALMTAGTSIAIEQALKPSDKIFRFNELRSFELLQNDAKVVGGGVGMALVGGAFFGSAGAIAGAMTGGKKTKGVVENLALKINLTDMDFPCVIITYINKRTKVSSNQYRKAISNAQETISCLELIIDRTASQSDEAIAEEQQKAAQQTGDTADAVIKLKQLLDMGVISQEEFNTKKAELLEGL